MWSIEKAVAVSIAAIVISVAVAIAAYFFSPKNPEVGRMQACHSMCFSNGTPSYVNGNCTCAGE